MYRSSISTKTFDIFVAFRKIAFLKVILFSHGCIILMINSLIGILIFVQFMSCFIVGVFRYMFMGACFANGLNITQFPLAIQLSSFVKLEIGRKYLSLQKLKSVEFVRDLHDILKGQ